MNKDFALVCVGVFRAGRFIGSWTVSRRGCREVRQRKPDGGPTACLRCCRFGAEQRQAGTAAPGHLRLKCAVIELFHLEPPHIQIALKTFMRRQGVRGVRRVRCRQDGDHKAADRPNHATLEWIQSRASGSYQKGLTSVDRGTIEFSASDGSRDV